MHMYKVPGRSLTRNHLLQGGGGGGGGGLFIVLRIDARFTVEILYGFMLGLLEMLYIVCFRFTVEMLYQLVWILLWKCLC